MKTQKKLILDTISDCAANFMYYDRKEDEELPRDAIEAAVKSGVITKSEIAQHFISECGLEDK